MADSGTNWKVWRNPEIAGRFAQRRAGMLGAEAQIDTMLRLVRLVEAPQLNVLDLGCGDGILLQAVMAAVPVRRAIALDGSPAMLEKAEIRFQDLGLLSGLVEFVEADFSTPEWLARIPDARFDAVVSGFAIHHQEDDRKRGIYQEIFGLLNPGGVFVNAEHVSSSTPLGEELFERAYAERVAAHRTSLGETVSAQEVYDELSTRPDKAANRLAPLELQLGWLRDIGFKDVDCYWKQLELALFAGYRR